MTREITLNKDNWKAAHTGYNFNYAGCYEMDVDTFRLLENTYRPKNVTFILDGDQYSLLEKTWQGRGRSTTRVYRFAKVPGTVCGSGVIREDLRLWFEPYKCIRSEMK